MYSSCASDARLELVLEQALLRRRQLVVDDEHLGARVVVGLLQLVQLALADVRARIRARPVLDEARDGLHTRGARKLFELRELVVGIDTLREHGQDEPALGLEARRGIRLTGRHRQSL